MDKLKGNIFAIVKFQIYEIMFGVCAVILSLKLNSFNSEIIIQQLGPIEMLEYNNYAALKYFVITIIMFVIAGIIIWKRVKQVVNDELETKEYFSIIIGIGIVLILLIVLFILINNPILRTIISVMGLISLAGVVASNQQ